MYKSDFGYDIIIEKGYSSLSQKIHDLLIPHIKAPWLDVGCNTGWLLESVPGGVGIDASVKMVNLAREKGLTVQHGWAESLPFNNNSFQTVVVSRVLEQCDDPFLAMQEAMRVGEKVIGINPYPAGSWGFISDDDWARNVLVPDLFEWRWSTTVERVNEDFWFFETIERV